ncbi:MAG: hypothetical protein NC122_07195, partial [Faecalibacterium sp.]|nr:hypothetical protein [Faecalibacterium sp.]
MDTDNSKRNDKKMMSVSDFTDDYFFEADDFSYPAYQPSEAVEIIIPTEFLSSAADDNTKRETKKPAKKQFHLNDILGVIASFIISIPSLIEKTGSITVNLITSFIEKYGHRLAVPFVLLGQALKKGFSSIKTTVANTPNHFAHDLKNMHYELKIIRKKSMALQSKRFSSYITALRKYFVLSFSRHSTFWKTVFNTAFPIVMIIAVVLTINYNSKKTFALDVIYNDSHLGFVESEDIFESAKAEAMKLLPENLGTASGGTFDASPIYKLSRVLPNQLSNQSMITENIIAASEVSLERACGIYIDGEFLCAVKNESDAVSVFNSLLAPSKKTASSDSIVAFV